MIDEVYKTVLTLLNKDLQGNITPEEFNLVASDIQNEIFKEYFEQVNRDKNRMNKGLTNRGYGNLSFNTGQKITPFASIDTVNSIDTLFDLPEDLYFIEDQGVTTTTDGVVLEEVERSDIGYMLRSQSGPSEVFPIYESIGNQIKVYPNTIEDIDIRYIRQPKTPKWTYIGSGTAPLFNPANPSYQDFELHPSEFSELVVRIVGRFGLVINDQTAIQVSETIKKDNLQKENN